MIFASIGRLAGIASLSAEFIPWFVSELFWSRTDPSAIARKARFRQDISWHAQNEVEEQKSPIENPAAIHFLTTRRRTILMIMRMKIA